MTTWIVFTALDGSLLDPRTFSNEAAKASLRRLDAAGVPVVPVTTRTFAEARPLAEQLDLEGPIVIESGGGSRGASAARGASKDAAGSRRRCVPPCRSSSDRPGHGCGSTRRCARTKRPRRQD